MERDVKQMEYLAGILRVLILNELARGTGYGYGIAKAIGEHSGGALTVRPESLYPVLHRMETEGLISAKWEQAKNGRPRKVYQLSLKGKKRWESVRESFISQCQGALRAIGVETAAG